MSTLPNDPITGQPYPSTAIQRILYLAPKVHVYAIPPLTSTKGYTAATWTDNNNANLIFTGRLRILETAIPKSSSSSSSSTATTNNNPTDDDDADEDLSITILLESPHDGTLFAAAPYTSPAAVSQALDSSRFFAVRVVGDAGRQKATLGLGFEERADAFDFSIALQDARRVLGWEAPGMGAGSAALTRNGGSSGPGGAKTGPAAAAARDDADKRDFSLKEGETITVSIGSRGRRPVLTPAASSSSSSSSPPRSSSTSDRDALFSIKPPPPPPSSSATAIGGGGSGGMPVLPPPPSASDVKAERRRSRLAYPQQHRHQLSESESASPPPLAQRGHLPPSNAAATMTMTSQASAKELGFDDGEFGEFQ